MRTLIFTLLTSVSISPVWANLFTADTAETDYLGYGGTVVYHNECHASGGTPVICDVGAWGTTALTPPFEDWLVGATAEADSGSYSVQTYAAATFNVNLVFDTSIPIAYFQFACIAISYGPWADCSLPSTNITGPLSYSSDRAVSSTEYVSYTPGEALHFDGFASAGSNDFGLLTSTALVWAYAYDRNFNFIPRSAWRAQLTPEPSELPLVGLGLIVLIGRLRKRH